MNSASPRYGSGSLRNPAARSSEGDAPKQGVGFGKTYELAWRVNLDTAASKRDAAAASSISSKSILLDEARWLVLVANEES